MKANRILLQKKYARVVEALAELEGVSLDEALEMLYGSQTYVLMREGVSDMHCRSDLYLAEDIAAEYR